VGSDLHPLVGLDVLDALGAYCGGWSPGMARHQRRLVEELDTGAEDEVVIAVTPGDIDDFFRGATSRRRLAAHVTGVAAAGC
jgi:hypothetical protein